MNMDTYKILLRMSLILLSIEGINRAYFKVW